MAFVTGKSWSGYNYYQGKATSRLEINTDLPIRISRAVDLGCHEGYPGHHVLNALLEQRLVEGKGWVEFSVYPLYSPQSLIAEGSANYGIDLAFPGRQYLQAEWGAVQGNLNLLWQKHVRASEPFDTELHYQVQLKYRASEQFEWGAQGFGSLGRWNKWAPSSEQEHKFGPAIFGKIRTGSKSAIKYNAAVLFGIEVKRRSGPQAA